ncbi:hypothetical protein [Photobacterium carnosum]|uniref:hypothetical protein n=1 Tax=Photobacterium carnosum TaxID=2023717 RepID=UPI001E42C594|nr:hypothetical protein [Photobacterium carnosum]
MSTDTVSMKHLACEQDVHAFLNRIRRTIYKHVRMPIGAAAARNCTLVKVASWAAKNVDGDNGVCVLDSENEENRVLSSMPISKLWGVDRKLTPKLQLLGLRTALDLKHCQLSKLKAFGKPIIELQAELQGTIVHDWRTIDFSEQQQIGSSRSIQSRLQTVDELKQALAYHLTEIAAKVRAAGQKSQYLKFIAQGADMITCQ